MPVESLLLIQTTLPDNTVAATLADALIDKRLAACVQISGPITSVYRWQGTIEKQQEFLLTIKTCPQNYAQIAAFFTEHHPYTVPEVIAIPVSKVNDTYLRWAMNECGLSR